MTKVYMVYYVRIERDLRWRAKLSRLVGLEDTIVNERTVRICDTEDKAKKFIRDAIAMDHRLNEVRRSRGLDARDYHPDLDDLRECHDVKSYGYEEDNVRTTFMYGYESFDVM